ncbi:MAG TPA: hypothetical protein VN181_15405, partial [Thermoanaerobaculia bacterium]|nr:hypothetical protein [Thermoanaerobaculia bacterium]
MRSFVTAVSVIIVAAIAGMLLELDCEWWPSALRGAFLAAPIAVIAGAALARPRLIVIAPLLVLSLGLVWLAFEFPESKDLLDPDVDTSFTPGFSEKKFNAITP